VIKKWKKHGQKIDYDCGFFQVQVHRSSSPVTGKKHPFYVLSTRDWVNVIALTPDQKVLMVSQYRHGSGKISLEIPGGAVDRKDASPLAAGKRELLEETGYKASRWHSLGQIHPNPAILNNTCFLFLATGAKRVASLKLDEAEELEVSLHPIKSIPGLIRKGRIRHALVVAAFYLFEQFKRKNPGKL
jgi:8-oxo-dGTP pyrophosphatase MutT (NUDIX family)